MGQGSASIDRVKGLSVSQFPLRPLSCLLEPEGGQGNIRQRREYFTLCPFGQGRQLPSVCPCRLLGQAWVIPLQVIARSNEVPRHSDHSRVTLLAGKSVASPRTLYQPGGDMFIMSMGGSQHLSGNLIRVKFRAENSNKKQNDSEKRAMRSSIEGHLPPPPQTASWKCGNTKSDANGGMPPLISWEDGSEASSEMEQGLPFLPGDGLPGEASTPFFPPPCLRKAFSNTTPLSVHASALAFLGSLG